LTFEVSLLIVVIALKAKIHESQAELRGRRHVVQHDRHEEPIR
jgi:hypothetical protein